MAPRLLTDAELRSQHGDAEVRRRATRDGSGVEEDGLVERTILRAESKALSILLGRFTDDQIPATPETTSDWLKSLIGYLTMYYLEDHYASRSGKSIADYTGAVDDLGRIGAGQLSAVLVDSPAVDSSRPLVASARRSAGAYDRPLTLESDSLGPWGHRQ